MELSVKSMNQASKLLKDFEDNYIKGISNSIKAATEGLYNKVLAYCYSNNINNTDPIHWDYDENTNVGRVWTNDWTLIFNEMGTGVVGASSPHPSPADPFKNWVYDEGGHGESGWWYPTTESDANPHKWVDPDGQLRAWTKGLPSRHMFYSAFQDIKDELGDYVNVELQKTVGNMYSKE